MSERPDLSAHNDAPDVTPLIEGLRSLDPHQVKAELDRQSAVDPSVGIIIAPLTDMEATAVNGQAFRYYGARILGGHPEDPRYVRPHVHQQGQEPYLILDGTSGEMNTGRIIDEGVAWDDPRDVSPGEVIVIEEGQVHSLANKGEAPFDFVFASPDSHLQDQTLENQAGDRMFTDHLDNPLPPHYPQEAP